MSDNVLHRERHPSADAADDLEALKSYLSSDEHLLWTGRPDPKAEAIGFYLGCFGTGLIVLASVIALILLFGIFGSANPMSTRAFLFAMLIVPAGIFLGGALLRREPRRRQEQARLSLHAVTSQRLLTLIRDGKGDEIIFIAARSIGPVHFAPMSGGKGTITIETHSTRAGDSTTSLTQTYAWFGVPDAAQAYRLIAELQRGEA